MKLRVLVVEDEKPQREALVSVLNAIPREELQAVGLEGIEVEPADCGAAAYHALTQAAVQARPYDLMLLDLGLPDHLNENEKPELGLQILDFARQQAAARVVIIISVFNELDRFVAPAFKLGAADFLSKNYDVEKVSGHILREWQRVKETLRRQLLAERKDANIKEVYFYFEKNFNYRFGSLLTRLLQTVRHETTILRNLGLSTDSFSMYAESLTTLEAAITQAEKEWQQLQAPFQLPEETRDSLSIVPALSRLAEELRPCLTVTLADESAQDTRILAFHDGVQNNVQLILREILVGGLTELSETEYERAWEIKIGITIEEHGAVLRFQDNFPRIKAELAQQINKQKLIAPLASQWRAWGLSVMQHLALRGGGHLTVEPLANSPEGNVIIYRVALADDDVSTAPDPSNS